MVSRELLHDVVSEVEGHAVAHAKEFDEGDGLRAGVQSIPSTQGGDYR